jgi:hypothetical protein
MAIFDGFNLWLGKTLAELFIVFLFFAVPLAGILLLAGYLKVKALFTPKDPHHDQ